MLLITAFVLMLLSVLWSRVRLSASVGAAVLVGVAALLSSRAGLVDPLTAGALGGSIAWAAGAAVLHRTAGAASAALLVGAALAQGTQPLAFGFDVVMAPMLLGGAFVWAAGGLRVEGPAGRAAVAVPLLSVAAAVWAMGAGTGLDALVARVPVTTLDGVGVGLVVLERETARLLPWRVELSWWVPTLLVGCGLLGGAAGIAGRDRRA